MQHPLTNRLNQGVPKQRTGVAGPGIDDRQERGGGFQPSQVVQTTPSNLNPVRNAFKQRIYTVKCLFKPKSKKLREPGI